MRGRRGRTPGRARCHRGGPRTSASPALARWRLGERAGGGSPHRGPEPGPPRAEPLRSPPSPGLGAEGPAGTRASRAPLAEAARQPARRSAAPARPRPRTRPPLCAAPRPGPARPLARPLPPAPLVRGGPSDRTPGAPCPPPGAALLAQRGRPRSGTPLGYAPAGPGAAAGRSGAVEALLPGRAAHGPAAPSGALFTCAEGSATADSHRRPALLFLKSLSARRRWPRRGGVIKRGGAARLRADALSGPGPERPPGAPSGPGPGPLLRVPPPHGEPRRR